MQLSKLASITRASIAQFESGSSNPGLESLLKLSQCLKISIDEMVSSPRSQSVLIKAADVPIDRRSKNGVILRKLLPEKLPATDMDELFLEPGHLLVGTPHIEGTREYFTCIRGEFKIIVQKKIHQLKVGDVLAFSGDQPHVYRNEGSKSAQGISVVLFN